MSDVVLDASALLALIRGEPGGERVAPYLGAAAISAVNVAEVYGRLLRDAFRPDELRRDIDSLQLEIHAFDADQAFIVGQMEPVLRPAGLSIADRACLALARSLRVPAVTADRQWAAIDTGVDVRLIR